MSCLHSDDKYTLMIAQGCSPGATKGQLARHYVCTERLSQTDATFRENDLLCLFLSKDIKHGSNSR